VLFDFDHSGPHVGSMSAVIAALTKAFGQLTDGAVLKVLAKSVALTVLVFIALGIGLYFGLLWAFARAGLSDGGLASATAAVLLAGFAFWFLFRLVAVAALQFFADEIVAAVEAKHYAHRANQAKTLPFARDLANSVRGIGRTFGVNLLALPVAGLLLVTGIGPALVFLLANAWLLGRELTDMAWLRHCGEAPAQNPVARHERLLLGGVVAGIMLVPGVNLLGPIVGAAAGTHLTHRALDGGGRVAGGG